MESRDVKPEPTIGASIYEPGAVQRRRAHALRMKTDIDVSAIDFVAIAGFAPVLIGRTPWAVRSSTAISSRPCASRPRIGVGVVDIALWDLGGKYHDAPRDRENGQGKTISQVTLEAFRQGLTSSGPTQWAAMSFLGGNMIYFGNAECGTFGIGEAEIESVGQGLGGFRIQVTI